MTSRLVRVVAPIVGVVGFLALWQLYVVARDVPAYELPRPSAILDHVASDVGFYVRNARITLWEASLGFAIALTGALLGAIVMAHSRFVDAAVQPVAVLVQVTPILAYAPAIVIWIGDFGTKPVVVVTALVCFVPFLLNGVRGLRSVDANLLELARSVDASWWEVLWRLRLPSALPYLFAAARIAVGLALIGAVLGEFFGSNGGLGYAIKVAQARPDLRMQLWGSIYVLALMGAVAMLVIGTLERIALRWHSSERD